MRIATYNAYENVISNLQSRQRGLQTSQEQLTSGKRVAKPSDDPVAAARAERALADMTRADAHRRALEAARTTTELTESALGDAGELIQQARETMMSAGNPSYTDGERAILVQSLKGIRNQLLSVANRSDGRGVVPVRGAGRVQAAFRRWRHGCHLPGRRWRHAGGFQRIAVDLAGWRAHLAAGAGGGQR